MAPTTFYALALAAASLAVAQPGHLAHRHLHKKSVAPYSYTNGTDSVLQEGAAGATGATTSTTTSAETDSTTTSTSTLTQYITSTVIDYVVASGSNSASGAQAAAATTTVTAGAAASEQCGGSIYITVTDTVTVTAQPSSSVSSSSSSSVSQNSTSSDTATLAALDGNLYGGYHPSSTESSTSTSAYVAPAAATATTSTEAAAAAATTSAAAAETYAPASTSSSTSTSTSAAAESASTGSSSGVQASALSTKRGCLYNYEMYSGCSILGAGETWVSWSANWASSSDWENATDVDQYFYETKGSYVPQLWGLGSTYTESWSANADTIAEAVAIMGYNEPDISSQASLSPSDAAAQWDLVYDYHSSGITIISPCVTSTIDSSGAYSGLTWLESFSEAGAAWDATGIHFYADCTSSASGQVGYLEAFVSAAYSKFSKPIWVTEFGCDSNGASFDQIGEFMTAAVDYLESESNVAHYAAFMASDGYLLTSSTPNAAGQAYVASKSS